MEYQKSSYQEIDIFRFGKLSSSKNKFTSIIYHVDGLLIDTGHSKASKQVYEATKNLNIQQICITHHHEDHSGNIKLLQNHFKCPVYGSKLCSNMMKNPPKLSLAQKLTWGSRPPFANIKPLKKTLKTNNYQFDIISIPGHAKDMIALYEPTKKWLFSADLYLNSYIGYFINNESILDQINSIKKVLALNFDSLLCSHNPQLKNGKEQLVKKLNYLENFYHEVIELHKKGKSPKQIFNKMELTEINFVKFLSFGKLSKMNMVKSAIRDYNNKK